jgi:hypothetical protein
MNVAILSLVIASAGPPGEASLPPIADVEVVSAQPLTHAEVHHGPMSTQIVAFDAEDQVAAEIVVWIVDEGHIRIDAACECLPLLVDEFQDLECPLF